MDASSYKPSSKLASRANLAPIYSHSASALYRCDEKSGLISVTIGTSAAARVVLRLESTTSTEMEGDSSRVLAKEAFCVPNGLWCYRLDKKRVVLGGALTDGGSVFEWVRRTLVLTHTVASEEVFREVEDMPPADHGLVVRFDE